MLSHGQHARITKKIINHDAGGRPIVCAWDDCDRDATVLYQTRHHEHAKTIGCDSPLAKHITYAFCTERHKRLWDNATGGNALESIARTGRAYGNLPVGSRGTII